MDQVYIDATIPSYLVARQSSDTKIAERQRITRKFWNDNRFEFILSDFVIDEIENGDKTEVTKRLQAVNRTSAFDREQFRSNSCDGVTQPKSNPSESIY